MSAKQLFEKFDKNKNGKISIDEFREGALAFNQNIPQETIIRIFRAIDVDGDGNLDANEYTPFFDKKLKEGFARCDADGDGKITSKEFHEEMVRIRNELTEEKCDEMVRAVDADGDGYISFEEYVNVITNMIS